MKEEEMIETILAAIPTYTSESRVYQMFEKWLRKQSSQNIFLIYLIATN